MKYATLTHKLIGRIKAWLSPKIIKIKTNDGKQFQLYNPNFPLETEIYWQGFENYHWEKETRKTWIELCGNAKVILDIGANSGIFSLLAKVYQPTASVYAFEPQPNVYHVLRKNNAINNFDIACQEIALSDIRGILPFYNYGRDPFGKGNTTAGSLNKDWRPTKQKRIDVAVTTLDAFLIATKIKSIDLIKIDVETLEAKVLKGYAQHLLLHKAIIVLEIQNVAIGTQINRFFEGNNYSYFNIDETTGLIPTRKLGNHKYSNYLICPSEKMGQIQNIQNRQKNNKMV